MSVMLNNGLSNNGVNEGGTTCEALSTGRCPTAQQRQPATARRIRKKWSYEENRIVMECFFRSNPKVFGYRKIMHDLWKDLGMFQISVMSNNGLSNNGVNEGGTTCEALSPGRCPTAQQRQPATARRIRKKWSFEENRIVMECFFRRNPKVFGYRKRMHDLWKDLGMFQISVMSNNGLSNNGVNEGGTTCEALSPGRCPTAQQRQPATARRIRKKWSYEENRIVMECFFRSNPKVFGYRKRMHDLWKDLGMFQISVMSNNGLSNNGVNEGGTTCEALSPGRCPTAQQRQPATARRIRKKWSFEENRIVMECFFRSNPKVFGYRKRMHDLWKDLGMFQISVMSNNGLSNNGVNEGGTTCEALSPGRCPTAQQRQPATARRIRKKWSYEENRIVMECFFRSNPKVFGYRKRMHDLWKDLGMFQISVMSNNGSSNNGVNEGGTTCEALSPGRCPTAQQRQPATARRIRKKWSYEENRIVMECFFRSNPKVFGYRKRMHDLWKDLGMFQISVMSNNGLSNNGVNEGGTTCEALSPGRCPTAQQRQPATARRIRKKWSYEENRIVMECFFRSNPKVFGYRKRMHDL